MKKMIEMAQEKMFDLIAERSQTANDSERARLTAEIRRLQELIDSLTS